MATKRDEQRITHTGSVRGSENTVATFELIGDPGVGKAIQITELTIQALEAGPVTCVLESGTGEIRDFRFVLDGDGVYQIYPTGLPHPWPPNEPLNMSLNAAKGVGYFFRYDIINENDAICAVTEF